MLRLATVPALLLIAACGGQSNQDALEEAAEQSDPAAAAVLENAAENGMDPQQALEQAGAAQAADSAREEPRSLQAKPNLPNSPNRPEGGEPPAKVETGNAAAATAEPKAQAEDEHAGHDME